MSAPHPKRPNSSSPPTTLTGAQSTVSEGGVRSLLHELRNAHGALGLSLDFIDRHDCSHAEYDGAVREALVAHQRITRHVEDIYAELERVGVLERGPSRGKK